jgi:phage/conjugal plasmid C-4 type zinc finger TraR family protein
MDERFLEQASEIEQAERDSALGAVRKTLTGSGQPYCDDCGEQIANDRRTANPAAIRCFACQTTFEHLKKGYA